MSFNIGDSIKIKPKEYFDKNYKFYSGYYFNRINNNVEATPDMVKHFGETTKIHDIRYLEFNKQQAYYLECNKDGGYWKDNMFELISDEENILDSVKNYCRKFCISECYEECPLYKHKIKLL